MESPKTYRPGQRIRGVYFIENPDYSAIKIGIAGDIYKRFCSIQSCNAATLKLLGYIACRFGGGGFLNLEGCIVIGNVLQHAS